MTRNTSTITRTTDDAENNSVLSYRVGQLEIAFTDFKKTVIDGQEKLDKKLSDLMQHYATKVELADVKNQAHEEHQRLWDKINEVDGRVGGVQVTVDGISQSNVSMSLVQKVVFGGISIALIAIANGVITAVFSK